MARAYLRLDPGFFDRKVIDQAYPPGAVAALIGVFCHAEHQPQRGRFRDLHVLRSLLGPVAKWVPLLIERGDLIEDGGRVYVDGWDEWQEGDLRVPDRLASIRGRAKAEGRALTGAERTALWRASKNTSPRDARASHPKRHASDEIVNGGDVTSHRHPSDGDRQSVIDSGSASGRHSADSQDARTPLARATPAEPGPSGTSAHRRRESEESSDELERSVF